MKQLLLAVLVTLLACGGAAAAEPAATDTTTEPSKYKRKLPRLEDRQKRKEKAREEGAPQPDVELRWYAGATVGQGTFGGWSTAVTVDDGSFTNGREDDTGTGGQLFVGFEAGKHHAFEFAYADLGSASYQAEADGSGFIWAAGPIRETIKMTGMMLSYQGGVAVAPRTSLFGRLGVNRWQSESSYTGTTNAVGPVRRDNDSNSWDLLVGAGVAFDASPSWRVRGSYVRYSFSDVGSSERSASVSALEASVAYRF